MNKEKSGDFNSFWMHCIWMHKHLLIDFRKDRASFTGVLYFLQSEAQSDSARIRALGIQGQW